MIKTRKRSPISKDERCRLVGCPNYIGPTEQEGEAKNSNELCVHCQGPVVWRDKRGVQHGMARACTSCPMNGRGLPVCFCACQGPSENLATDGQKMVTIGGIDDEDSYIQKNLSSLYARERPEYTDGRVVAIDAGDQNESEVADEDKVARIRLVIFRRLLETSGKELADIREGASRGSQERVTSRLHLPRQMEECAKAVINAVGTLTPMQWEIVRSLALGKNQAQIARLVGVRKQAVNQAIQRLVRGSSDWVLRLVKHCQ